MARDSSPHDLHVNNLGTQEFLDIAARFGGDEYAFVVTPNVDHLIRYRRDAVFREFYRRARYVLLDSRFLALLLRATTGMRIPTCPGSDLTAALFRSVITPDDTVVVIGGDPTQTDTLRRTYGLRGLRHYNPPMGFIDDPKAVDACLDFIEAASPFRFCFLAVGSPQQETLADLLLARGRARGLALCIGGAINFLTGVERRAPQWIQNCGFEWLYRLAQNPSRLAQRYLVRGPRIFLLLPTMKFILRAQSGQPRQAPLPSQTPSPPRCTHD